MVSSFPKMQKSSASFSQSIRNRLRLKNLQAQAKNFCRVLDIRVAQIVEADIRQPGAPENLLEAVIRGAGRHRFLRREQTRENPLGQRRLAPLLEQMERAGRQEDAARSLFGFRLAHLQPAARHHTDCPTHAELAGALIKILPLQSADLTPSEPCGKLRIEEVIPQGLVTDRFHEPVELFLVEHLHGRICAPWDCGAVGRVVRDQPRPYSRVHNLMQQHMDAAYHTAGEWMPRPAVTGLCLLALEQVIESLHVAPRDGSKLLTAKRRADMILNAPTIAAHGARAERRLGILREPAIHPLAQRNASVLRELHPAIAADCLVQSRHELLLRFGEHGLVDRHSIVLVPDDDAAFPSSVRAFAHHAVAVRSFLCHGLHLLCSTNTYHTFGRIATSFSSNFNHSTPKQSLILSDYFRKAVTHSTPTLKLGATRGEKSENPCATGVAGRC